MYNCAFSVRSEGQLHEPQRLRVQSARILCEYCDASLFLWFEALSTYYVVFNEIGYAMYNTRVPCHAWVVGRLAPCLLWETAAASVSSLSQSLRRRFAHPDNMMMMIRKWRWSFSSILYFQQWLPAVSRSLRCQCRCLSRSRRWETTSASRLATGCGQRMSKSWQGTVCLFVLLLFFYVAVM